MSDLDEPAQWERLLAAERHLQALVPAAILVRGTAAALHVRHRRSLDGDHVLADLRDRFDEVLATLEAAAGWQTNRVQRPVVILGALDGVPTGIRQLRRSRPLETELIDGLCGPTLAEMALDHADDVRVEVIRELERRGRRRRPRLPRKRGVIDRGGRARSRPSEWSPPVRCSGHVDVAPPGRNSQARVP